LVNDKKAVYKRNKRCFNSWSVLYCWWIFAFLSGSTVEKQKWSAHCLTAVWQCAFHYRYVKV
jgi:hypothetical protein